VRYAWNAAIVLVAAFLGYLGVRFFQFKGEWSTAAASLPDVLARAKTAGVPLELSDIGLDREVPDSENAAPNYRKAIAALEAISPTERAELAETLMQARWKTGAINTEAGSARKRVQPILNHVLEAASKPKLDFGRDWNLGFEVTFPEYAPMKEIAKLLSYDALLEANSGNIERALDKLEACMRMGHHVSQEPTLVSMLVHMAFDSIASHHIKILVSKRSNSAADLTAIENMLKRIPAVPSFKRAVAGEIVGVRKGVARLRSLRQFENLGDGAHPTAEASTELKPPLGISIETFRAAIDARNLEFWARMYSKVDDSAPDQSGRQLDLVAKEYEDSGDTTYKVASIFLPVFAPAGDAILRDRTLRLLNQTKIDILQYRLATGKYPTSLVVLGPKPIDPFDKGPLRYRQTSNGFILYSIGRNRVDDGGVAKDPTGKQATLDEVVEHPFSPANSKK
jgi:hypothetical protein